MLFDCDRVILGFFGFLGEVVFKVAFLGCGFGHVSPLLILLINLFVETTCRTFDPSSPVVSLTLILPTKPLAVMSLRMARSVLIRQGISSDLDRVHDEGLSQFFAHVELVLDAVCRRRRSQRLLRLLDGQLRSLFRLYSLSSELSMVRSAEQHLAYALRPFSPSP